MGDYRSALIYYTKVVDDYHDTQYAPMALYDKINLLVSIDKNDEAIQEIDKFLERYPDDKRAEELKEEKASIEVNLSASNDQSKESK